MTSTQKRRSSVRRAHGFRVHCRTAIAAVLLGAAAGPVAAAPPTAQDDIDYRASGFSLPRGAVLPASWAGPMAGGPTPQMAMYGPMGPPMGGAGMPGMPSMSMPGTQSMTSTLPSAPLGPGGMPMMPPQGYPQPAYAPAGALPPAPYGVAPVNYQSEMMMGGPMMGAPMMSGPMMSGGYDAMPTSYGGCCQSGGCDGSCGCDSGGCQFEGLLPALMGGCGSRSDCACDACASGCGGDSCCLGSGGVLGKARSGQGCLGDSDLGLLAGYLGGGAMGCLSGLMPFSEGGKCAQRWYDISLESMFLTQNPSGLGNGFVVANLGDSGVDGVANDPVLSLGDANDGSLEAGLRLSLAMIFGAGGNLEMTYMGGHEWESSGSASRTAGTRLTSFLSGFGEDPDGGFENTSDFQSVAQSARFHSVELNYRRRTVGPYCKFQGSWLLGMRYLRYDNDFNYLTLGDQGLITSFDQRFGSDNNFFGAQAGFDFWWNVAPGISLGTELKGAVGQNDWDRVTSFNADLGAPTVINDGGRNGTVMGELAVTALYRFSYSWTFRSSYHLIGIDDIVTPTIDRDLFNDAFATAITTPPPITESSLAITGFTLGLEYLW